MRTIRKNEIITNCGYDWPPEITGDGPFYAINPYVGCAHNCSYCWSRDLAKRFGKSWGYPDWFVDNIEEEWKNPLVVENALELLEEELKTKKPGRVLLSSMTDPYQPIEAELELTREIIWSLNYARGWLPIILTKASHLPERGITQTNDLWMLAARFIYPWFGVTLDGEPDNCRTSTANYHRRNLLLSAHRQGIKTFVSFEPWLPGIDGTEVIRQVGVLADFWIIGSLNKAGQTVNRKFYEQEAPKLKAWLEDQGIPHYFKHEIRRAAEMEG